MLPLFQGESDGRLAKIAWGKEERIKVLKKTLESTKSQACRQTDPEKYLLSKGRLQGDASRGGRSDKLMFKFVFLNIP